jgi:tetratricopeptide (TPR) repeat protein
VTDRAFEVAHISEIPTQRGVEGSSWARIRRRFDVRAFGVNAYTAPAAGGRVIEDHTETGPAAGRHEELYVVLEGRARFTVGDEELDAPAGTLVFVRDPATRRGAIAEEAGTTVLVVGGRAGEPYEVSPWEDFAEAWPHYEAKEYAAAIEIFHRGLEQHPENASALYNLACCESLAGDPAAALEHLRRAVELHAEFGRYAGGDSDFDAIRDDPAFASAIAGKA